MMYSGQSIISVSIDEPAEEEHDHEHWYDSENWYIYPHIIEYEERLIACFAKLFNGQCFVLLRKLEERAINSLIFNYVELNNFNELV